jgi:SAM-dependent methyltransferase
MTADFWDERYRSSDSVWSGDPNPQLVAEVSDLAPGRALDIGSGEGADAIWLAERAWHVTAIDISGVALERSAAAAEKAGADVAGRIDWRRADITEWSPDAGAYDLVSAQFMQLPKDVRDPVFRGLTGAVAPGGTLLIVGHHPSDLETTVRRPRGAGVLYAADDVAALLEPARWDVLVNAARARSVTDSEGRAVTVHDAVLRAVRFGAPAGL